MTTRTGLCIGLAALLGLGSGSAFSAKPAADRAGADYVCAVVPMSDSDVAAAMADVLEGQLAGESGITFVNRVDLKAVISEQILSAVVSPEGVASRLELGKATKSDLLIFLRERKGEDATAIEVAVAETKGGLRLVVQSAVWNADAVEKIARDFTAAVHRARSLAGRDDLRILAVSPFESRDLGSEQQHRRRSFAVLVEAFLMTVPGNVVVELREAQAFAREMALAGGKLRRKMPHYVLGSYKSVRTDRGVAFDLAVALRHGTDVIGKWSRRRVSPTKVARVLQTAVGSLAARIPDHPTAPTGVEARVLNERADVFKDLGEWDEASPLYEAALLLDPENLHAHLSLFRGLSKQMIRGGRHTLRSGQLSYDPTGRTRYANQALNHLAVLLQAGHVTREVLGRLSRYQGYCHISGYDVENDPDGVVPAYRRVRRRWVEMVYALLADPQRRSGLKRSQIHSLAPYAVLPPITQSSADRQAHFDSIHRLLPVLDEAGCSPPTLLYCASTAGRQSTEADALLTRFWDGLDDSDSEQVRRAGRIARILHRIHDQETFDVVWKELTESGPSADLLGNYKSRVRALAERRLTFMLGKAGATPTEASIVPTFTRLDEVLRVVDDKRRKPEHPSGILTWQCCGPKSEVVGTSRGLYRLEGSRNLRLILPGQTGTLWWDGKYVWTRTGREVIAVDPKRGEVARFVGPDFAPGITKFGGLLAPIRPGTVCLFAFVRHGEPAALRTWASLLTVKASRRGPAKKRIEMVLECREQKDHGQSTGLRNAETAFIPQWTVTVPAAKGQGPWVLVGRKTLRPLVLDLATKAAHVTPKVWPQCPRVVRHDEKVLIASGRIGAYKERSVIQGINHPDEAPALLIGFSQRPSRVQAHMQESYYQSLVVVDNTLHLLASAWTKGRTAVPAWVAVDLDTLDAHVMVSEFPDDIGRSHWDRLCVSHRFGLVVIARSRAYGVKLPPSKAWPKFGAAHRSSKR